MAQGREQARVDDRGFATTRATHDGRGVGGCAPAGFGDKLVHKPLAAEEQTRILFAKWQEATIGRQARKQTGHYGVINRFSLHTRDEALQCLGLVEALAQIDPSVEAEKAPER